MKVVFSRKGVDSAAGACASALIHGRPVSLPIPTREPSCITYGQLASELGTLAFELGNGLHHARPCHLDPDLVREALPSRHPDWRGAFGQVSSSLSHLKRMGVGVGDLFLFWGLYRPVTRETGSWRYCGPRQHAIYGWLKVGAAYDLQHEREGVLEQEPWLEAHPHIQPGWKGPNTLFVAAESLDLDRRQFAGSGVFKSAYTLSDPSDRLPSVWTVPAWLDPTRGGVGMTYHPEQRWKGDGRLQSAARGQEFVADISDRPDAAKWIADLLEAHQ